MTFLRGTRLREVVAAVQALRSQGIAVTGPFRTQNGAYVCSITDQALAGDETQEVANPVELGGDGFPASSAESEEKFR